MHLAANRSAKGKDKEKKDRDEREESKIEAYRVLIMTLSVFAWTDSVTIISIITVCTWVLSVPDIGCSYGTSLITVISRNLTSDCVHGMLMCRRTIDS